MMVDARLDDAREAGNKLLSKGSRWRTKYFTKDEAAPEEQHKAKPGRADTFKLNEDVNDFLKPSTEKANAQQQAAAAFLASKPKIDVASAQRWPGAQKVLSAAASDKSPGPGGLRTSSRKKGLTVNFARTQPAIIGHGGDECEEPSLEVSRRKKANSVSEADRLRSQSQSQNVQDDAHVSARTPQFNGMTRTAWHASTRSPRPTSPTHIAARSGA